MQTNTICLTFNNQAEEAANYYVSVFKNASITRIVRMGPEGPSETGNVLLVLFEMNGVKYMALNGGPSFTFTHGISIMVNCDSQEEIDYVWSRLTADGGKEVECGWLVDKFGVSWQVVPSNIGQLLNSKDPKKSKRVFDALMQMKKINMPTLLKAFDEA